MEDELRTAPATYRNAMSAKLRLYRRDLGKLQRDMKNSIPSLGSSFQPGESHHGIYSSQNQQSVSLGLWTVQCYHILKTENNSEINIVIFISYELSPLFFRCPFLFLLYFLFLQIVAHSPW